jgi:hypothetical protein
MLLYKEPWNGVDKQYECLLSIGFYEFDEVIVNALNEDDAVDACANWLQANGYIGLYKTSEEYEEMEDEDKLYVSAGNDCLYIPLVSLKEFKIPTGERVVEAIGSRKLSLANQIAKNEWDNETLIKYLTGLVDTLDDMLLLFGITYYAEAMKSVAINMADKMGIPVPTSLKD